LDELEVLEFPLRSKWQSGLFEIDDGISDDPSRRCRPRGGIDFSRTSESLPISAESYYKNIVSTWTAEWRRVATLGAGGSEGLWFSR
jgi:hypothetical protein